jgi:hypothetical protein
VSSRPESDAWPLYDGRRFLIAAGAAIYEHLPPEVQLPSVEGDLEAICDLFESLNAVRVLGDVSQNVRQREFEEHLHRWLRQRGRTSTDALIFYYSGHGADGEDGRHYLYATDTEEDFLATTAIQTEKIVELLAGSKLRHLLVLLDTCYAGQGGEDLVAAALRAARRKTENSHTRDEAGLWFIAASRRREEAEEGAFVQALVSAIGNDSLGGARQQYLDVGAVVRAVNLELGQRGFQQRVVANAIDFTAECLALPNPRYRPGTREGISVAEQRDLIIHWDPKARGAISEADPGWYFSGRSQALNDLANWLTARKPSHNMIVVTGGPGSGKSAVLSRLATLSDPVYRVQMPAEELVRAKALPRHAISAAILAKGKTMSEVVVEIARVAHVDADNPRELLSTLRARHEEGRLRRMALVVDALDEATEPDIIATDLLTPLANAAAAEGFKIRLIVGTRSELLRALGDVEVIDLDKEPYLDPEAIIEYVERCLLAGGNPMSASPYRDQPELARQAAIAIAEKAGHTFLVARIFVNRFVHARKPVDITDSAWHERPAGIEEAFEQDLARLGTAREWARDLLTPLAYSEGAGLPWEDIWPSVASRVSGRQYYDDDIRRLLTIAGSYITERLEHERSAYRLYHEAFAEYFREPDQELGVQYAITDALREITPAFAHVNRKDWRLAHPYIRAHLASHAAAAGRLDELLTDPAYLAVTEPVRLGRLLGEWRTHEARQAAQVYSLARRWLRSNSAAENASYIEMFARCEEATALASGLAEFDVGQVWRVSWAHWRRKERSWLIGLHRGSVAAATINKYRGRLALVTAGRDGTVRRWDLATGSAIGGPMTGHRGRVRSVVVGDRDGQPIIVSGGEDGTIRRWDLATGRAIGEPLTGHRGWVRSVVVGDRDGQPIIVSGGHDGTVRRWDLTSGAVIEGFLFRHRRDPVHALAVGQLAGRQIVVGGGQRGDLQCWDLVTGRDFGEPRATA